MPKRQDLQTILIIGSGPIVIGQACEFDYAGTQAIRALKEEGYRVVLVNSNPATIMTSPDLADQTYIEPLTRQSLLQIIQKEKPDALLPTMGGQTALNLAKLLSEQGDLERHNVELIGATVEAINRAEDRAAFYALMQSLGLRVPRSVMITAADDLSKAIAPLGFPLIMRSSFTLGGTGGGVIPDLQALQERCQAIFSLSPQAQIELSESLLGFKEFELEVVRDRADNAIIVCSIENIQPMGVHTGDSATVAPQQTLTDKEYQRMRAQAFQVIRAVGVETGGANVQFAVNPNTGEQYVIEMNPRVSRSSALASKATGFPIAKIAAKLAVGYTLDELSNDMTQGLTPASFEPTLDYVVTKLPYFQFEKFQIEQPQLGTQMHAIGEVMAIGRTFNESFFKAFASLEQKNCLLSDDCEHMHYTHPDCLRAVIAALKQGKSEDEVIERSGIDPWFIYQWQSIFNMQPLDKMQLFMQGLSSQQVQAITRVPFVAKQALNYLHIDSCAAEFPVATDYLYGTRETTCELVLSDKPRVLIIGSGPNRIGQGIEFDYSCVEAIHAAAQLGYETMMLNSNPETVSTDYDVADLLFFDPIDAESVLNVIEKTKPTHVMVQFGCQTPIHLLDSLLAAKCPVHSSLATAIHQTEDRERFNQFLAQIGLRSAAYEMVQSLEEALAFAKKQNYPLLLRPSYVIGGQGIAKVKNQDELEHYFEKYGHTFQSVQIEMYFEDAIEFDIDAISDGQQVLVAGILEHIEPLGIHSGDSIQALPPYSIDDRVRQKLIQLTQRVALGLNYVGPLNIQVALYQDRLFVIEVNPRCSRSLPFVAKATGVALARVAMRCLLGQTLKAQGFEQELLPTLNAVKVPVFVFDRFQNVDPLLGPEMKSTGEVMGLGFSLADAGMKAAQAAGLPSQIEKIYLSLAQPEEYTLVEDLFPQVLICSEIEQCDLVIDTKMDDATLRRRALTHEVCYISSFRTARFLAAVSSNQINALCSLQNWQEEVRDYAACTSDKERGRSFAGGARFLEESGTS